MVDEKGFDKRFVELLMEYASYYQADCFHEQTRIFDFPNEYTEQEKLQAKQRLDDVCLVVNFLDLELSKNEKEDNQ